MEMSKTWAEIKSFIADKKLKLQYEDMTDTPARYFLFVNDENIIYKCTLIKGTDDATDFENNYKSESNAPIHPLADFDAVPYVRVTEKTVGKMMQLYGIESECVANDSTSYDVSWEEDIEFVGIRGTVEQSHRGDYIDATIIDKDNILGYGANFVVTEFGIGIPARYLEMHGCVFDTTTAVTIPAGLYLRLTYVNTHATETSYVYAVLRYYV